ncbi:MAG: hypothetical protein SPJ62_05635 [Inconstantimicrobium porci]|uniref:hypothetical protein n=1 Tax=Inconstantimicrobium porci TaxID=2652291 RepID=UPI002A909E04|nr:hypothetical protein [Inconstantimicrobium porci]MDY5911484.1 hypothetical protein [Inconstantimicrobium porci]
MKRNVKTVLSVCLIAALFLPTFGAKSNIKSNKGLHHIVKTLSVDPAPERF